MDGHGWTWMDMDVQLENIGNDRLWIPYDSTDFMLDEPF